MSAQQFQTSLKGPCARVALALSATDLSMDLYSDTNPFCVVYEWAPWGSAGHVENAFVEIGRTAMIENSLEAEWGPICLDYYFEIKQRLAFSIYSRNEVDTDDLLQHDFLGRCECDLASIVTAAESGHQMAIMNAPRNKRDGRLKVVAGEVNEGQREHHHFLCCASSLRTDGTPPAQVYLEFSRILEDGSHQMVHRTELVKNTADGPQWRAFELTVKGLGGKSREFLIECFQQQQPSPKLLGSARTSLARLLGMQQRLVQLLDEHGHQLQSSIRFEDFRSRQEPTFYDHLSSGMQLDCAVAVDLTTSDSGALHQLNSQHMNQYECAIHAVLETCGQYSESAQFQALGFGERIPSTSSSIENEGHPFPLRPTSARRGQAVQGVSGVLEAYRNAVASAQLYGPTNFEPTIRAFLEQSEQFPRDGTKFQVLLILTARLIPDMDAAMAAIIEASQQPITIIVVGIGYDDFEAMEVLNPAPGKPLLSHNGRTAVRDVVRFLALRTLFTGSVWPTSEAGQERLKAALAREVLAGVPEQVTSFIRAAKRAAPSSTSGTSTAWGH